MRASDVREPRYLISCADYHPEESQPLGVRHSAQNLYHDELEFVAGHKADCLLAIPGCGSLGGRQERASVYCLSIARSVMGHLLEHLTA